MGVVSSLFDAVTFTVQLKLFDTDAASFQTGWFVESIATQILVIFLIRSRRAPWRAGRPNTILLATSIGALGVGIAVALSPWGSLFGFTGLSVTLASAIALITTLYLEHDPEKWKPVFRNDHAQTKR
ncbi:MAG: cation transporting ATPase C-terminal domain-containing protein [Acidobacteriaceae bacterium]|nr:cation transporting ATPase C-terminal domain-containing protein [Acidobacteriaceae bacterium]